MKWVRSILLLLAVLLGAWLARPAATEQIVRFQAMDLFIDSKETPLAAYQLEFLVKSGDAKVVGVEGGEHQAFQEAPFYDPLAIQRERVIIAAFNTTSADKLPKGKTRVATIHLQVGGYRQPQFELKLEAAATIGGRSVSVEATFAERKTE